MLIGALGGFGAAFMLGALNPRIEVSDTALLVFVIVGAIAGYSVGG